MPMRQTILLSVLQKFHLEFEYTHPFIDGNGRIERVINNLLFLKEGFVSINIQFINRQQYYDAFREYDKSSKTNIMEKKSIFFQ